MNLYAQTLSDYLIKIVRPAIIEQGSSKELRVFITSQPPSLIYETARMLEEYLNSLQAQIQFQFKIGGALWESWVHFENDPYEISCIEKISENNWVDKEDKLTHYRNLKWDASTGYDYLVVVLVGVELARDQASLQDFFRVDTKTIWEVVLKKTFKFWIQKVFQENSIYSQDEQIDEMDELLNVLLKNSAGDLLKIASFLEQLNFQGCQDGNDALKIMYDGLNYWDLPKLNDMAFRERNRWTSYVTDAEKFFTYKMFLKNSERKKYFNKISVFKEKCENGEDDYPLDSNGEFGDIDDFFSCLREYISENTPSSREKLLKVDFAPIRDKILKVKKPGPPRSTSMTKIDAHPLEAVLSALWRVNIDFKKLCNSKNVLPASVLERISIESIKFRHDLDTADDGKDLIKGCIGGIDNFIENNLVIELELDDDQKIIPVSSTLLPTDLNLLRVEKAGVGVPGFQFKIIFHAEDGLYVERDFQWQLPETQAYRNLWNLAKEVHDQLPQATACLPVFTIPTYNEIFLSSDEEEANRILKLGCNGMQVANLYNLSQLDQNNPLLSKIGDLSHHFGKFIHALYEEGYFYAIGEPWEKLRKIYRNILRLLVKNSDYGPTNQIAPLIYKAFSIIPKQELDNSFASSLNSAVVTGLHPALLEMLRNREAFLIHGILEKLKIFLSDSTGLKATTQQWDSVCDLATVKYPLFGLVDSNKRLDTRIKSFGLIHCFGKPHETAVTLSAKTLLRSDENEEDDMADSALFRENRESLVIKKLLEEYCMVYPHAEDGISFAVINADNFQTLISGIDAFLKDRLSKYDASESTPPYHFSLTLFTLANQQQEASRYLQEWQKRWDVTHEATSKFGYYRHCRLSVAHRVANDNNDLGLSEYTKLANRSDFEVDLVMLVNFITSGAMANEVEKSKPFLGNQEIDQPLKFPVVEMPRCGNLHPAHIFERAKVISNRRFRLATLLSDLGVYFIHPGYQIGDEYIVISKGDYGKWRPLIDKLHKQATWIVCLDSAIDEKLASQEDSETGVRKREIIGFSSGLGFRGELNYTISTERSSLADVEKEIVKQVNRICGISDIDSLNKVAHFLVNESRKLSGLSLVRATGPGEKHIRDLISSTLVRISFPKSDDQKFCLCDELISLDAFSHWFESSASQNRPDLLRIVAYLENDGVISINAHMVECKLAMEGNAHLEKARMQLEIGLRHLMKVFLPRNNNSAFDQRYWWAQLQRLIASKSRVADDKQFKVTHALEFLGEGSFKISWQAMAVVFWTDSNSDSYKRGQQWDFFFKDKQISIDVISAGVGILVKLCDNKNNIELPCSGSRAYFSVVENQEENVPEQSVEVNDKVIDDQDQKTEEEVIEENNITQTTVSVSNKEKELEDENVKPKVPDRVFLGKTLGGIQKEVFWEYGHSQLTNRHFLIFGKSGVGKTYAIQSILMELSRKGQNSVIIDYTNGFLKKQLESEFKETVKPKDHIVKKSPLPLNPFRRQRLVIDEDFEDVEDAYSVAGRITSVFTSVYSSFGEQQKALLHKVIEQGIESFEDNYDFGRLLEDLENEESSIAVNVANKLTPLSRAKLFMGEMQNSWSEIFSDNDSRVNILQLAGLSRDLAKMATEFTLWDLYDFACNQGKKSRPLPIVLDEIQNLDNRLDAPLAKILTEGRKFGLSAILATQTLSNLPQEARDRLFQATHKLFFKPAETELKEYASILANATHDKIDIWKDRLSKLNKGECYSLGPALNTKTGALEEKPFPIKISSLKERIERTAK